MMGAPAEERRATSPWPISPPAPVISTTGFRIGQRFWQNAQYEDNPAHPDLLVGGRHRRVGARAGYARLRATHVSHRVARQAGSAARALPQSQQHAAAETR